MELALEAVRFAGIVRAAMGPQANGERLLTLEDVAGVFAGAPWCAEIPHDRCGSRGGSDSGVVPSW